MNAKIYSSLTGELIGTVENFDADRYENACDNAEGHVAASDVLTDEQLTGLGIAGDVSVYALCNYAEANATAEEFISGIAAALECERIEAGEQWAGYSRNITDRERAAIEAEGYDRGVEIGREIAAL